MQPLGSYYAVTPDMYQPPAVGTPGWYQAPVPGWGVNPMRAGPARVGVGGAMPYNDAVLPRYRQVGGCTACGDAAGDQYLTMTAGHVALAAAGGIVVGLAAMYAWKSRKKAK